MAVPRNGAAEKRSPKSDASPIRPATRHARWLLPLAGIALLATLPARTLLEQFMLTHVLVQLPLFALAGWWLAHGLTKNTPVVLPYPYALPLLIWCLTLTMIWMLPRVLDASLEHPSFIAFKIVSLPFLLGFPLRYAWQSTGPITKAFFVANLLSMAIVLAWLYIEAPFRLCNYYLIGEQRLLGITLLLIAGTVSLYWTIRLFAGKNPA